MPDEPGDPRSEPGMTKGLEPGMTEGSEPEMTVREEEVQYEAMDDSGCCGGNRISDAA